MLYKASCHCGQVAFEAEGELDKLTQCNCSICSKRGALHWFVPGEKFRLLTPEANLGTYTFNKHVIHHRYCLNCGVAPYSEGTTPTGARMVAVNARCLDDTDLSQLPVGHYDGRSL